MTNFALGFIVSAAWIGSLVTAFFLGAYSTAKDAEDRLTGKVPVDDFWRRRGMK